MAVSSNAPVLFGRFTVTPAVFHTTRYTMAFVNLKPLLPGHVLVSPRRIVPRMHELSQDELFDFILTIQRVTKLVERVYQAAACNVAMQDGEAAGQSVPHVHMHIIPRKANDMEGQGGMDAIYALLESEEGDIGMHWAERAFRRERPQFPRVDEAARRPRGDEEMKAEADMLQKEMDAEEARL